MYEWATARLGEVCVTLRAGGTPPSEDLEYYGGDIPFVTIEDMTRAGRAIEITKKTITHAGMQACAAWLVPPGHLLFSMYATLGKVTVNTVPVATNQAILAIKPHDDVLDQRYLHQLLEWAKPSISRMAAQTTQPNLSAEVVRRIPIRFPRATKVQQRIAEILSTVDEAIEQTEALIAKTQRIKAGLMHDLFTRGVTADGQLRPPHEEAPQLYKESPLGWIPKEWEAGHLIDRRAPNRPHIKTGPFGSSLKLEHWVDEGVPVITIGALGEGEFINSQLLYVSESTAERLREYRLSEGDIVFSRVADVGRSAAITADELGWIMSSNLMRISLDSALVVSAFLQAQLAYDSRVRTQIRTTVNASGREVANSAILNRLYFAWPERHEQERIVWRLDVLEARRRCLIDDIEKLRHLKAGLMHDLLTGRHPVTEAAAANIANPADPRLGLAREAECPWLGRVSTPALGSSICAKNAHGRSCGIGV